MRKRIIWGILLLAECLMIAFCFLSYKRPARNYTLEPSAFSATEGVFLENFQDTGLDGYYIDSSWEKTWDFVSTEAINLPPGRYEVKIYCVTQEGPHTYALHSENAGFKLGQGSGKEKLPEGESCESVYIGGLFGVKNMHFTFDFQGGRVCTDWENRNNRAEDVAAGTYGGTVVSVGTDLFVCPPQRQDM